MSFGNAADDLPRIALPGQHVSVGHARHGDVLITFAPSAAGGSGPQQSRRKRVLQIPAQDAVLDQHVLLRGNAFVVHVQRSAAAADGSVVDHGAQRARHLLADAAAEGGNALAVEIGFQAMADGFMQQDPRPSRSQHDDRFARGRVHGRELHDRLTRGFFGEMLGRFLVQEEIQRHASAAAGITLLRNAVGLASQRRDAHARHRLAIETQAAVARRHQNFANAVGIVRDHLKHAAVIRASGRIGALHQVHALGQAQFVRRGHHRIEVVFAGLLEAGFHHARRTAGDQGGHARGLRIFSGLRSSL